MVGNEQGRPRSKEVTHAVLQTALDLAYEGGVHYATIERISDRVGIAKSTIYRRWPNAASVVLNAFMNDISPLIAYKPDGKIDDILKGTVKTLVGALNGKRGSLLRQILGLAQCEPELRSAFLTQWINPRREMGERALQRAIERGELSPDADLGLLLDTIYGAVYYRLAVSFISIDSKFVDQIVDRAFCGVLLERH